jgi:PAS domain S-box-containing protein
MPPDATPSLVELATLLGECVFTFHGPTRRLKVFGGPALGLPAEPGPAGEALLGGLAEADRARLEALWLGEGRTGTLEVRCQGKGGPARWLEFHAAARASPGDLVGRVTDVTGRRQLERALRILHERTAALTGQAYLDEVVAALAEALDMSFAFIGPFVPGRTDLVRTAACWRGGRPAEAFEYEVAGTPCEEVLKAQVCAVSSGVARRFPRDARLTTFGLESYLGVSIPGPDGRPRGVLAALDERPTTPPSQVTALLGLYASGVAAELHRLESEQRLVESEVRFRQIVTSCAEGVALLARDGRILYANPQLAALLGHPSAEAVIGRSAFNYSPPALHADLARRIDSRTVGVAEHYETRLLNRTGGEIRVEVSVAPLPGPDGKLNHTIALFRDVTEERALDEQVREAQKLESLGRLAGGVAHDFNNLLVGILGNSSFAAAELPEGSEVRAAVEDVHASARKASELTRQLLAYSGRGKFAVGPVSIDTVVAEMARLARPSLRRGAQVVLDLQGDLPPLEADAGQIGQVVVNLLTNASDALAEQGGRIGVRTDLVQADRTMLARFHGSEALPEGPYVRLTVEDDGAGMDEATRQRIFEPFFSTKFAGRGLGLAAALGIVKGHRGAIRVDSEPGRGTSFSVLLPPGHRATASPPVPERVAPPGPAAVLVADDEAVVRRVARRALEKAGHVVIEAADGREAVAAFHAHAGRVACVLLDLTMPGMGGEEALAAIRELSAKVPVVLTSGWAGGDEPPPGGGESGVRFLPKPFLPDDLVEAVRAALAGAA